MLHLVLDDFFQDLVVFILVIFGLPRGGHGFDERARHLQFLRTGSFFGGSFEFRRFQQILGIVHQFKHESLFLRLDGGEVLAGFDDDLGNADLAGIDERLAQEHIGFFAALGGLHVIRLVEQ